MAGTITCGTLSDGTNSTSSTNCIQGSAKAWVNFNGVPAILIIRASYNVSSVTKTTTGAWVVNLTNALVDINYVTLACGATTFQTAGYNSMWDATPITSSTFAVNSTTNSGGPGDRGVVCAAAFR